MLDVLVKDNLTDTPLLRDFIQAMARDGYAPSYRQISMMLALRDAGGTLDFSAVAQQVGTNKSSTSRACEALVERGFAQNHTNPNDRRRATIRLTLAGHGWLNAHGL